MQNVFSPDSKFMRGMSRAADLVVLNLLFLLTSIPIVTIGPSVAALYSVAFSIGTARESGVVKPYFRALKSSFFIALKVWLILLAVGAALSADLVLVSNFDGAMAWMNIVFWILLTVELLGASMVFPWISLFRNTVMENLKNGVILGIANLPRAIVILLLWGLPVLLLFYFPLAFFNAAVLWIFVYFAFAAYLSSLLLRKVFAPYLPEDMFREEEA